MKTYSFFHPETQATLGSVKAERMEQGDGGIIRFLDQQGKLIAVTQASSSVVILDAESQFPLLKVSPLVTVPAQAQETI